ncbi:MAG: acyl carrier protein [Flavobacteriaceae bacterium]|jgi:acyl carrier protein
MFNIQKTPTIMSDKKEMISELKSIVKPYIQDEEAYNNLDENTDFINDLKINSANLVDVILDIEDTYDIELDNESMDKMLNVKAALEVINTKISEK